MKVLITGATGNVGKEVVNTLSSYEDISLFAGVRDIERSKKLFLENNCSFCSLDFEKGIYPNISFDAIFLVRPPHLADPKVFKKFLEQYQNAKVVFLSVQGAEKKSYLPHAKIEKVILELNIKHVFIRPSYFMENLTTTLYDELLLNKRIYLPSGELKFNWIALSDVAEISSKALISDIPQETVDVSNNEFYSFSEVVKMINDVTGSDIKYVSPSLLAFVFNSIKRKVKISFISVMLLLHYLPKFSKRSQEVTSQYRSVMGKSPRKLSEFIKYNKKNFSFIKQG